MAQTRGLAPLSRLTLIIVIALTLLAGTRSAAAAASGGVDGNRFVGPNFGFSVEWDDAIWTPTDNSDATIDILALEGDLGQVQVSATNQFGSDTDACLRSMRDLFANDEAVSGYHDVRRGVPLPDTAGEAGTTVGVFAFSYTYNGETADVMQYAQCSPLGKDAVLSTGFIVYDATDAARPFAAMLPYFEDVHATLTFAGDAAASSTPAGTTPGKLPKIGKVEDAAADGTPTSGDEESYTSASYGYRVAYDPADWNLRDQSEDGLQLERTGSLVTFMGVDDGGAALADCAENGADVMFKNVGFDDFDVASGLDAPSTTGDADGTLYVATIEDGGEPATMVQWAECRHTSDGQFLFVSMMTARERYDDMLPRWEALLEGIEA